MCLYCSIIDLYGYDAKRLDTAGENGPLVVFLAEEKSFDFQAGTLMLKLDK